MRTPSRIALSASTICQLNCPLCTVSYRKNGKADANGPGWGHLKFIDFKKLLDQNPQIRSAELSWKGEIFLNPELKNIIEYAYKRGVELRADRGVNLNNVSKDTLECLVKYKFKSLTISLDGASQKVYKIYRRNGDFNRVKKNIIIINYFKNKYSSELPYLTWQFIIFGHNEHEILKAKRFAACLGMKFKTRLSWDSTYSPAKNAYSREGFAKKYGHDYLSYACKDLITSPVINYDGMLFGCCENDRTSFGNVFKNGLSKCLSSKEYSRMIGVAFGIFKSSKDIPCYYCKIYKNNSGGMDQKRIKRGICG
ncbi:MAG: SPASM domain-containing protein [Candidatus Omnitrophica bacterium]|nr:SPASM domain-containing protein [Candidatus Omnitrophota bacterium]